MENMTIEDIELRISAIETEKELPDADIDALTEEVRALMERKEALKAEAEKRSAELTAVIEDTTADITKPVEEERKMDVVEIRKSQAYVDAYAEYIKNGDDTECRKLLSENGTNGTVAVPELVDDIVRHAWDKEGIMSLVKKSYIKGNLKIGFEISADGAVVHTEGGDAPAEEKLILGITELVPESIKKWITISDEAMDLGGEAFLRYIYEEVAYQIAKKAADEIIADIEACGTVSTNTSKKNVVAVPKVTQASIAMGTVASALGLLSDEAANPVIVMNKATWPLFKTVQYSNGWNGDPFEGLKVLFNNSIKAYSVATTGETYAIVGDFGFGAQANFPNGEEITFKFDDKSLAESDLVKVVGREYIGHDIVAPKAFVKIVK